jgi:hypothetical protein
MKNKSITVQEADNGFVLETYDPAMSGGDGGYVRRVANSPKDVSKELSALLGEKAKGRTLLPYKELDSE